MARTKASPVSVSDRKVIGGLLRDIRRAAGYRSVESAAATKGCPASRPTIYAYERGGLVPSLPQFLELVEFFVLEAPMPDAPGAKPRTDLRAHGISAVTRALTLPAYHVTQATDLIARMQPDLGAKSMISALTAIDHVGVAVDDLEAAVEHYGRTLGVKPVLRERVVDQGVEEVLFAAGGSFIQLLGALGPDTPVGRFLASNGPGIHHVAYRVSDVASTLEQLRRENIRLIDEVPRAGSRNTLIAFVHPKSMGGVLVELVQEG